MCSPLIMDGCGCQDYVGRVTLSLRPKSHPIFSVNHFFSTQSPIDITIGPWSKVVYYIGNRVPFGNVSLLQQTDQEAMVAPLGPWPPGSHFGSSKFICQLYGEDSLPVSPHTAFFCRYVTDNSMFCLSCFGSRPRRLVSVSKGLGFTGVCVLRVR